MRKFIGPKEVEKFALKHGGDWSKMYQASQEAEKAAKSGVIDLSTSEGRREVRRKYFSQHIRLSDEEEAPVSKKTKVAAGTEVELTEGDDGIEVVGCGQDEKEGEVLAWLNETETVTMQQEDSVKQAAGG